MFWNPYYCNNISILSSIYTESKDFLETKLITEVCTDSTILLYNNISNILDIAGDKAIDLSDS